MKKISAALLFLSGALTGSIGFWAARQAQKGPKYELRTSNVWNESIVHYSPDDIWDFSEASEALTKKLRATYPSEESRVLLVPTTSGYDICIFADFQARGAREFIESKIQDLTSVREELAVAYRARERLIKSKKEPNQAPEPTR